MVTYTDKAVAGAQVFVFRDRMVERLDLSVKLETQKHDAGETLLVRNDLYAPVEVELSLNNVSNAVGAPEKPIRWVLPPRSKIRLATLAPADASKAMRYKPRLRYAPGRPAPAALALPLPAALGGRPVPPDPGRQRPQPLHPGRYAQDVAMPEGTPIVAARPGMVVKIENQQSGRGNNPSGNFVRILHNDGTMGVYLHLMRGSVKVQEGQRVAIGEQIGRSGNTGNSTGPHLHFVIQRNVGLALESIPFQFAQPVDTLPNFAVGGE